MGATKKIQMTESMVRLDKALREGAAVKRELGMDSIIVDPDLQSRVGTDPEHVARLSEAMLAGIDLPPVIVFYDSVSGAYWLSDGFHRYSAHRKLDRKSIWCYVFNGAMKDALLYSVSANLENSKPTTKEDRKKAVMMLFREVFDMTDDEVGRRSGVSRSTVVRYRIEYCEQHGLKPRKQTRNTRPTYRIYRDKNGREWAYCVGAGPLKNLGKPSPESEQRFKDHVEKYFESKKSVATLIEKDGEDRTERSTRSTRITLGSNGEFANYLTRNASVSASCLGKQGSPITAVRILDYVCVLCRSTKPSDVIYAIGMLTLAIREYLVGGRGVVVCYIDRKPGNELFIDRLPELISHLGYRVMPPEEVVARVIDETSRSDFRE